MAWFYRFGLVGGVALILAQACGGRSSSDFDLYGEPSGGASSGHGGVVASGGSQGSGGFAVGGAASVGGTVGTGGGFAEGGAYSMGGAFAVGGTVGTGGAYGGTYGTGGGFGEGGALAVGGAFGTGGGFGEGGALAVGGAFGFGGAFGTAGAGPIGGGPNHGEITRSCVGFCQAYWAVCGGPANPGICGNQCVRQLSEAPPHCQPGAIDALDCLAVMLAGQMNCDQAMILAVVACGSLLGDLQCN